MMARASSMPSEKGSKTLSRDRVAYTGHLGTYAEASVVPASKLIPLPVDLSFEQGAAFPLQRGRLGRSAASR